MHLHWILFSILSRTQISSISKYLIHTSYKITKIEIVDDIELNFELSRSSRDIEWMDSRQADTEFAKQAVIKRMQWTIVDPIRSQSCYFFVWRMARSPIRSVQCCQWAKQTDGRQCHPSVQQHTHTRTQIDFCCGWNNCSGNVECNVCSTNTLCHRHVNTFQFFHLSLTVSGVRMTIRLGVQL